MTEIAVAPRKEQGAFSFKLMIALLLVGVFSFSAYITLGTFEPELRRGADGRAHALSRSAIGYAAAAQLARARGADVSVSRTPAAQIYEPSLVVLTPEYGLSLHDLDGLTHQRVLVILPKWFGFPRADNPGWVTDVMLLPEEAGIGVMSDIAPSARLERAEGTTRPRLHFNKSAALDASSEPFVAGPVANLQTVNGAGLEPVLTLDNGDMLIARMADRPVYILADPDFLNTQGLASVDNARIGMAIFDALAEDSDQILFDVTINGFARSRSLLRIAFVPPFLAATLSLVAAAALLAWRSVSRAGPHARTRRAIALGKKTLAENSAALIRLVGREYRMGWAYAQLTAVNLAEMMGAGRLESQPAIALLDRMGTAQGMGVKFSDLASEAAAAENGAQMLAAARKLHSWKEEMLRATR